MTLLRRPVLVRSAAGATALVVLLSGCATVSAPVPGFTDAERATVQQQERDFRWQFTGLPDDLRPPDREMRLISLDEWAEFIVGCMNAAGFDSYEVSGTGYQYSTPQGPNAEAQAITQYVCETSVWIEDAGYFNPAQLDYLYDYYQQSLVPCLELRGGHMTTVPSRAEFVELRGGWHPLYALDQEDADRLLAIDALPEQCPLMPPGMPDLGFAQLWD